MTYTTTAAWLDYASQRRDSVPGEAGPGDQEAALMRAEDYIRLHYVARFLPGLDLARADVAAALAEAVHLAASVEVRQPHAFTATFTPADQKMLVKLEGLEWEAVGEASGSESRADLATLKHSSIESLLAPYLAARYGFYGTGAMAV